jgi:hypothetical protein
VAARVSVIEGTVGPNLHRRGRVVDLDVAGRLAHGRGGLARLHICRGGGRCGADRCCGSPRRQQQGEVYRAFAKRTRMGPPAISGLVDLLDQHVRDRPDARALVVTCDRVQVSYGVLAA